MKKLILSLTICFGFLSSTMAQEVGVTMATTQTVYAGSTNVYDVTPDANFDFEWEVYTDEDCTPGNEATGEVTFNGAKNLASVSITWDGPSPVADKDYYLKLTKTSKVDGCPNFKVLHVILKATNDMDVVFASNVSDDCSVNLTGDNVKIPVTLSGLGLVHEAGKAVSVWYTVNSLVEAEAVELSVSTTQEDGSYFITIPNIDLIDLNPLAEQNYVIRLFKAKNGTGVEKDLDETTHKHTRTSHALPTVDDIQF